MALSSTTLQPVPHNEPSNTSNAPAGSLLAALVLSVYAAQRSNKQLRKLKRKAMLTLMKLKFQQAFGSLFSKHQTVGGISTQTLLYILLGLLVLILLFTLPAVVAIIVLLVGILLILLTRH
ncbi:MAG: hypothetical protein JWP27_2027 [Flaviaesturariibacter sp.]|nr:hypothetical protein [Flaviaesturariibacter sp.]